MGRSVADLELMARVLFGERGGSQDCFPVPIPYRDVTLPKKLRFGYYLNGASSATLDCAVLMRIYTQQTDGLVKGSPACHRAVLETVEALRKAGHECVQIDPPDSASKYLSLLGDEPKLGSSHRVAPTFHWNHFRRRVPEADRPPWP
jgi:amidase